MDVSYCRFSELKIGRLNDLLFMKIARCCYCHQEPGIHEHKLASLRPQLN